VLLVGLPHHCLAAFLEREQRTGRGFDKARWKRFNASVVGELSKREYDDVRLETFQKDGSHFPCETLAATIRERATKLLGQSAIES
jgi:hypothetical protein